MRVCITIPVFNEEAVLAGNIERLHRFLTEGSAYAGSVYPIPRAISAVPSGRRHLWRVDPGVQTPGYFQASRRDFFRRGRPPNVETLGYSQTSPRDEAGGEVPRFGGRHAGGLDWTVQIADNGSTDGTLQIARELARTFEGVQVLHLDQKGRGGALKTAWRKGEAEVLAYMDADLSTDLAAVPDLLEPLITGKADICIGSRLLPGSVTTRCLKREILSRGYNFLVRRVLGVSVRDAQCGFKAINRRVAEEVLPLVQDDGWFFDTELLVLAQRLGYRILEIPVTWLERRETHVKLCGTIFCDLAGIVRLRRKRGPA